MFTSKPLLFCLAISLFFLSCQKSTEKISPYLLSLEKLMKHSPDSSLKMMKELNISNLDIYNQCYYYLLLAENEYEVGHIPSSSHLISVIDFYNKEKQKDLESRAWLSLGRTRIHFEDMEESLNCFLNSKELIINDQKNPILFQINDELADIYIKAGLFQNASNIYFDNLSISENLKDTTKIILSLRNIGYTYFFSSNIDSAFYYLNRGLEISNDLNNSSYLSDLIYSDMSLYFEFIGDFDQSFHFLNKIENETYCTFLNKGILSFRMENFLAAESFLFLSIKSNDLYIMATSYYFLSQIEEKKENYKQHSLYFNKYNILKDSIEMKKTSQNIKSIIHKNKIHSLNKSHQKILDKYSMVITIVVGFVFISFCFFIIRWFFLKNNMSKSIGLKIKSPNIQKQLYSNQIDLNKELEKYYMKKIDYLQCKMFKMTDIYKKINELIKDKKNDPYDKRILKMEERKILTKEIYYCFSEFILIIKQLYPQLKEDDIILCCLTKLGFSTKIICLCFGFLDSNPIRQKKYKVKQKMLKNNDSLEFFYSIFPQK